MHFLVWGIYQGVMLVVHKEFQLLKEKLSWLKAAIDSKPGHILSMLLTFHIVCIGWVFFRAETNSLALEMIKRMLTLAPAQTMVAGQIQSLSMLLPTINYPLIYPSIFLLLPVLAAGHILMGRLDESSKAGQSWLNHTPKLAKAAWVCAMIFLIVVFSPDRSPRFIYFQF